MSDSTVTVGAPTDTGPTYNVTLTRKAADTFTDFTTATGVVLIFTDGSTRTVTKVSATATQWVGTIKYTAWFTARDVYKSKPRVTFADGTVITSTDRLIFSVGDTA